MTIGVDNSNFKNITKKNLTKENLRIIIKHNLRSLENIIVYNVKNNIRMYRITSDLIPFGSSELNNLDWEKEFKEEFDYIASIIEKNKIRVSMHPGQYCVINSPDEDVVKRSFDDLRYHNKILDLLKVDYNCKIVLHVGGAYGDKKEAIERFILNYQKLDKNIKKRLIIENDDKIFNIEDVLYISKETNIPVVYDNLHNYVNPSNKGVMSDNFWLKKALKTWPSNQKMKTHYSQQDTSKNKGAHTKTIFLKPFLKYFNELDVDADIMLEVKDKNVSCIKCKNIIIKNIEKSALEKEWSKYKYYILERNQNDYKKIRELLKEEKNNLALEFYEIIEKNINKEVSSLNGVEHVWGYFKKVADNREKNFYLKKIKEFEQNKAKTITSLKTFLYKLANKYKNKYLLESYFFDL